MAARGNSTGWSPYVKVYDPLKAGSIDGTDLIPHDNAVVRAICAEYKPPSASTVQSKPSNTIFVGRLNLRTTDDQLHEEFSKFGSVKSCRVVRDVITGISRGYGFVEFKREADAQTAWHVGHGSTFHERQILVEWEFSRTMPGWIPRRLGGGLGGKKESGQLRFGGRDRPFKRPFILPPEQDTVDRKSSLKVFDTPKQLKTNNDSERTNFGWSPQDKRFHHKSNFDDDQSRHRKKTGSSSHEKNRKWQSRDRGNNQSRYEDDRHKYRKENDERSRHTYDQDSRKYNRQSTSHFTNYSDNHQKNYTEEKMSHYSHLVGFRRKSGKYGEDIESSYFEETVKTDDVKEGQRSDNKNSHRRSCNNKDYCRQETSKFTSENEEKQKETRHN